VRERYLRIDEEGELVFAVLPCPLLRSKRCSVYEHRPEDCRAYPHLNRSEMRSRLPKVVENAERCPIVFEVLERVRGQHRRPRGGGG
jgi:hypothetical protein